MSKRGVEGLRARLEVEAGKARAKLHEAAVAYGATWAGMRALDGKIVTTADIDAALAEACSGAVHSEESETVQ